MAKQQPTQNRNKISIDKIKYIVEEIISDDEWVNDSHTHAEHKGIRAGLYALIHHIEKLLNEK